MKLCSWFAAFTFFIAGTSARAQSLNLHTELNEQTNFLTGSIESSSFTVNGGSISGSGMKAAFTHFFAQKYAVDVYLTSAFFGDSGLESIFTGVGGSLSYNLWGECCSSVKTTSLSGHSFLTESRKMGSLLQVAVGADQYFLDGTHAVYSASGVSVGANYDFDAWNFRIRASGRYSTLTANQLPVQGFILSLGMMFPL